MRLALSSRSLPGGRIAAAIREAAGLGVEAIEIRLDDVWGADEAPQELAARAREHGLALSAYAQTSTLNIISPDPEERERSMRWAVEAIALTHRLGAGTLTIEAGRLVPGRQTLQTGWRPFLSAARTLAKAAEAEGVRVGLENPPPADDRVLTYLVDAQSLLREVDSPCIGVTLNLSHLTASDEDPVDWAGGLDRVFQLRVSVDRPRRTLPRVLGGAQQRALFIDRLRAAGYSGQVVLDDPYLPTTPERIPDAVAQVRRWFIVRRPAPHRRPSPVGLPAPSANFHLFE